MTLHVTINELITTIYTTPALSLVSKYNFASLGSVQLQVVLSCPAPHVVNFAASRVCTARWYNDVQGGPKWIPSFIFGITSVIQRRF